MALPVNTSAPVASGTPTRGSAVSVTTGSWSNSPTSYTYAWEVSSDAGATWTDLAVFAVWFGGPVDGEDTATFTVNHNALAMAPGGDLRCKVTATNGDGSTEAYSNTLSPVAGITDKAFSDIIQDTVAVGGTATVDNYFAAYPAVTNFTYQWQISNDGTSGWTDISGATSSTYTPVSANELKWIRVKVNGSNTYGSAEGFSDTARVGSLPAATTAPTNWNYAIVGQSGPIINGSWTGSPTITYAYQWQVSNNGTSGWTNISGATSSSYTPTSDILGKYIRGQVIATNPLGSTTASTNASGPVTWPPTKTSPPTISGTAQRNQILTANNGTWEGAATITYARQWQYSANGTSGWTDISGATASTYQISGTYLGQYIRVRITATNSYSSTTAFSAATAQITGAPALTTAPTMSGTFKVGNTVSTTNGTWTGFPAITYTYQWKHATTVNGTYSNIPGATSSSYTIASTYAGRYIKCFVTATNSISSGEDAATGVLVTQTPVNTAIPTISGSTERIGDTLTASAGTWTGTPTPTYTYNWQYSSDGISGWTNSGTTTSTYTPNAFFGGFYFRVQVTATNSAGNATATSNPTGQFLWAPSVNVPTISGTATIGSTLTSNTPLAQGYPVPTLSYQWQRSPTGTGSWTNISGATSQTYVITSDDAEKYLRVNATATNTAGADTKSSTATAKVPGPPTNTASPVVSGTPVVGQTLSTTDGSWTGATPITYAYQWQSSADGSSWSNISGATSSSYTISGNERGKQIRAQVTATNSVDTATANSNATAAVTDAPINTAIPTISGTALVGETLSATAGTWTGYPNPTFTYQWQKEDEDTSSWSNISGATSATYAPLATVQGKRLRVKVTATNSEGSANEYSAATGKVFNALSNTVPPTISGTPRVGQTLSQTSFGTWDGYPTVTVFDVGWQVLEDTGWEPISGAHNSTLLLTNAHAGKQIRLLVTGNNSVNGDQTATSNALGPVTRTPSNTAEPYIADNSTVKVGDTISTTDGTWAGYPTPTITYQWKRSPVSSSTWTNIEGATSSSYTTTSADAGKVLQCVVTGTNEAGTSSSLTNITNPVATVPTTTTGPSISGTYQVGQLVTAEPGTYGGVPTPTTSFQWQRSTSGTGDWSNISGQTADTYLLAPEDEAKYVRVKVTAANFAGSITEYSEPSTQVLRPPVNASTPVISGTLKPGETITATDGTWAGTPAPTFAYQWQRSTDNGTTYANISGQTSNEYELTAQDNGNLVRIRVVATNSLGSDTAYSSGSYTEVFTPQVYRSFSRPFKPRGIPRPGRLRRRLFGG